MLKKAETKIATASLYPKTDLGKRKFALWYFTILISVWTIAGHAFLGFEQSYLHPIVAVLAAGITQFLLEYIDAWVNQRSARYEKDPLLFFCPAVISGLACAMLLYPNERFAPIIFAAVLSIASKVMFRVKLASGRYHHFLNPSNFGIVATLFLLPWVGQAPPYQFTENVTGAAHWAIPSAILISGIFVHAYATGRVLLCAAWIFGFVIQALIRATLGGDSWFVPLTPMSSAAFILFTLYMVPDPATTPLRKSSQVIFGLSVAATYGFLQANHVVFGLFLSLTIVCVARGATLWFVEFVCKSNLQWYPSFLRPIANNETT